MCSSNSGSSGQLTSLEEDAFCAKTPTTRTCFGVSVQMSGVDTGAQYKGVGNERQADDATEARDNMDQSELFGRVIRVAPAKPQKDHNQGLGSKTAIWEQEDYLATHAGKDEEQTGDAQAAAEEQQTMDPMQGLEGLDVAGPKPQ